jgi:hypothetical protein
MSTLTSITILLPREEFLEQRPHEAASHSSEGRKTSELKSWFAKKGLAFPSLLTAAGAPRTSSPAQGNQLVFSSGYANLDPAAIDQLEAFFSNLDWSDPKRVCLIVHPEKDDAQIFKPCVTTADDNSSDDIRLTLIMSRFEVNRGHEDANAAFGRPYAMAILNQILMDDGVEGLTPLSWPSGHDADKNYEVERARCPYLEVATGEYRLDTGVFDDFTSAFE